jgi:K+-transporting ATPase ATPase C chain
MVRQLLTALKALVAFTIVCGVAYPLLVLGIGQGAFGHQADGSLVKVDGSEVGSSLIGQTFTAPEYLHGRPSAAGQHGYDASASSGSNLGPSNPDLLDAVTERADAYREENDLPDDYPVPVDAVTASASGLDPDISVANAELQAPRIARERHLDVDEVLDVIGEHTDRRFLGFMGEDAVNVLETNIALDALTAS